MIPTAESSDHFFSKKTSQCDTAESDGVHPTTESSSAVCFAPQSQAHTAESLKRHHEGNGKLTVEGQRKKWSQIIGSFRIGP